MPRPPEGEPAPVGGELPGSALESVGRAPLAIYVHVPFCRVRCGYCDFNTYTPADLDDRTDGPARAFVTAALTEMDLARAVLPAEAPAVDTVFFGGGTPTLLPPGDLARLLHGIRERFGLRPDAEVTTEANPDSVDETTLAALAEAGVTRVSLGMQSAVPHVLRALDRTHDPAGVARAVQAARSHGLAVSLDLIYGTPGESLADWQSSLRAALALDPDHVSAYALTVEPGTKLAARIGRGELAAPEDDDEADKYLLLDAAMAAAGMQWYEISNWARDPGQRCRHNLHYWRSANWWGVGPGAHSHVGGVRWWNVAHPSTYAGRLREGRSPALARELLGEVERREEQILLRIRLREGLPADDVPERGRGQLARLAAVGLVDPDKLADRGTLVLTVRGRLLADLVVGRVLGLSAGI